MAINIKINEKEQVNELLGALLGWGIVAALIGKLLGFKFNLESNDQMTKWGVGLGDAFKISRQRLKKSGIPPEDQARIDRILNNADVQIRRKVQVESERLKKSPGAARSTTIDREIQAECDRAVQQIEAVVKDPQQAEEYVAPLRATFDELTSGLESTRMSAAIQAVRTNPELRRAVTTALTTPGTPVNPTAVDAMIEAIASGIGRSMSGTP